jgi:hypothetical protein
MNYIDNESFVKTDDFIRLIKTYDNLNFFKANFNKSEISIFADFFHFELSKVELLKKSYRTSNSLETVPITVIEQILFLLARLLLIKKKYDLFYKFCETIASFEEFSLPLHFALNSYQEELYKTRDIESDSIENTLKICKLDLQLLKKYNLPVVNYSLPCLERIVIIYEKIKDDKKVYMYLKEITEITKGNGKTGVKMLRKLKTLEKANMKYLDKK